MKSKMLFVIFTLLLVSLTIVLTGCTTCKILARGNQPIILNTLPEKYTVLGHFSKEKSFYFDYTRSPDLSDFIRESTVTYPNADAIVNVFVTVKTSIGDFLMDVFTLTIARAYTVQVEGDIIQYIR